MLLNELDSLNLPEDKYAITSSGPLAVRELRTANDLDLVVTPDLWEELSQKYIVRKEKFASIQIGNIQVLGLGSHFIRADLEPAEKQIANADIIDGKRYVKLETVSKFKSILGREKDLRDIELIDNFLSRDKEK